MPPWRKGRGLGPFTSARPAAGPLLSSQPHAATNHPEQPLSAILATPMSTCGAWPGRCPAADVVRLPTDIGPPTGRTRLALLGVERYGGGSGPVARRLDRRAYSRTRRGCAPGGHPCRLGIDASAAERCFTQRTKGSAVRQWRRARFGYGAQCRREAAPLRSYGLEYGPEVWREIRRLLLRHGEQAPAVSGTKSSSCTHGGCQATGPRPFSRSTAPSECARQQGRG
jgi:hypothetical protein